MEIKMKVKETPISDLFVIELERYDDHRGFFIEAFSNKKFKEAGFDYEFVQDNHSRSP